MRKFKRSKFLFIFFISFALLSFKPADKYVRKALRQLEKGNLKEAKSMYVKALETNPEHFKANVGMGLLLSELLDNYTGALPYLEKAFNISTKDTLVQLMYALAKCYHHNGEYEKAIGLFDRLNGYQDYEEEIDFGKDIKKRKEDCYYAIKNRAFTPPLNWYIVNAGKNVNTEMPEYVPVLTQQNELIFTSRRKDHKNEQLSYLDGKYMESMYIAKINNSGINEPRRYTLPDQLLKAHATKKHESVVSMSPDGKKLFTFHDNKIFEISMEERGSKKPKKLLNTINFDFYQNHAFLTKDGATLFFTSEAEGGLGGIDIYRSTKIKEGEWSKPENIGGPVNTEFDEDAPFITDDGKTMYFASTGHEGFGNFDIYKTNLTDGKWSKPENLGQPINSPGHDIFFVNDNKQNVGFFSSSRSGGYGDMDIYKINYLDNLNKECPAEKSTVVSINISDAEPKDLKNIVELKVPAGYKILEYEWKVNEKIIANPNGLFDHDYKEEGTYTVTSKVIAYCDTCFSPLIACNIIENKFEKKIKTDSAIAVTEPVVPKELSKGELSKDELAAIGFNSNPILFGFDKSSLRDDAQDILNTNVEVLKKYRDLRIEVIGYTDSRGSQRHNKLLSVKRAKTVKNYLAKKGVKNTQFKFSTGKGSSELVNDCGPGKDCDNELHQLNRRVVFKVYNK